MSERDSWVSELDERLGEAFDKIDTPDELDFERGLDLVNDLMWDRWRASHPTLVEPTTGERK